MASPIVVLDSSAIIAWLTAQAGGEGVKALLLTNAEVYLHRQNASEVWYQIHRAAALKAFLAANAGRVAANGKPDLTGLDFNDRTIFDTEAGQLAADTTLAQIEATGVQIVGDETFPDVWRMASTIKSKYRRVSLADCFGMSLALALNAPFWTSDRHELEALAQAKVLTVHFIR